jgi:hypothetical protein
VRSELKPDVRSPRLLYSMTYDDMLADYGRQQKARRDHALASNQELIAAFRSFAFSKGVSLTIDNFDYVMKVGIIAAAPDLTHRLITPLSRDRDGLYSFADLSTHFCLDRFQPGYLFQPNFVAMAHPCFRRVLYGGNHFAPRFIELFWNFDNLKSSRYLALDDDRVRIDVDGPACMERDTWFGAPFSRDIASIPEGITKLSPPTDTQRINSTFFADAYCLDIKWTDGKHMKSFQALELKSETVTMDYQCRTYHPARYVHAEFDISVGAFRHFDGAIQYLSKEEYQQRRDSDFNHNAKSRSHLKARSHKIFKINGRIEVDEWSELFCHFLAGNPLAVEYISGSYPPHVDNALAMIRAKQAQ